jgi:hypothetical protein
MRSLITLALVGLAFAAMDDTDYDRVYSEIHPYQIEDTAFRSGREYKYFYDGQVMTGLPGTSKQHSATRIQCLVILQVQNGKSLMKLTHIRMGRLNRKVPNPRAELPFGAFESAEIQPHLREQLQKPVQFKWENGQVDELVLDSKDEPWSVNIKRGVLNMLHVKLRDHSRPDTETNQIDIAGSAVRHYRTLEKTLEGECEVIYNIESLPSLRYSTGRPVLNVTKSINFEACQNRPEVKYNWRFHQDCPSCDPKFQEDEKSLKSATVIKYNITGDRENFLIESVKVESHYLLVPFSEEANVITSYVNQTLVLYKTSAIQTQIEEPRNPVESESDLVFSLKWEQWKEKFYMEGDKSFHTRNPYPKVTNKLEVISNLVYKLVKAAENEVSILAPKFLDQLIIVLRTCDKQHIDEVHEHIYKGASSKFTTPEEKKKAKDLIVNCLALCGTKECVFHLIHKIESGELPTIRAASAMRQLHQARLVSPKMIHELKRLAEVPRVRDSYLLKQSVYLTLGSMIYTACGDQNDQYALETSQYYAKTTGGDRDASKIICTDAQKHEFVDWMWQKFEQAANVEDQILCLKMIGNSGLQINIQKLEKVILQKERHYHAKTRVAAISATRLLIENLPKKVQRVLVPLMMNKYEDPEVRIAGAYFTLQTFPDRFLLNMIAKDLNVEPNIQYRSFLWTYLTDMANATSPCFKELATNLKLALRFAHKVEKSFTASKIRKFSFYSETYKTGFDLEPMLVMSNQSFVPRQIGLNIARTGYGFFGKWASSFGLSASGLDQLLWKLMGPSSSFSANQRWTSELKSIHDYMKVSKSYYRSPRDPMAYFYYRYLGQDLFYYPIKTDILKRFAEQGLESLTSSFDTQSISRWFNEPFDVSYATLLNDFKHKIPTTLGMPLSFNYKTPLVATIKGKLEPQIKGDMRSISLNVHLKPSVAVKLIESIEIWNPIINNGLKVVVEGKLFTPVNAVIKVDTTTHEKIVKVVFEPPTKTKEIVVLQSRPVSYTRVWPTSLTVMQEAEEITIQGQEHNRVRTVDRSYFESMLGVKLQVKGRYHWTPAVRVPNTPFTPYSGPNKLIVEIKPGVSVPQKIELILKGKFSQSGESFSPELSYNPSWQEESSSSENSQVLSSMRSPRTRGERSIERSSGSASQEQTGTSSNPKANMKHELLFTLKTIGGAHEREIKLQTDLKYSPYLELVKINGKLHVSPMPKFSSSPLSTCFKGEILYPQTPMTTKSIYDKKVQGELKINWVPSGDCTYDSSSSSYIKATLQAERSSQQLQDETNDFEYWQCRKSQKPMACQAYLAKAGELKKYVVNVDYKDVPMGVRNFTSKLWRAMKYRYFWQSDVAEIKVHNPEDKIKAIFRLDPFTDRLLNITVKTPKENVTMYDVPLPFYMRPLNMKRSIFKQYYENTLFGRNAPMCEISESRVKTFDEAEFGFRLGTCWTVLAKDCSSDRTFAILAKRVNGAESEDKAVKIITPYGKVKLIKNPTSDAIVMEKDGQMTAMRPGQPIEIVQHGRVIMSAQLESSHYVKVYLPESQVKVYFDGYAVNVKMQSPIYMGRQCGICGNMDQDANPQTEFYRLDSDNQDYYEPEFNIRKAFHQYTIKDDSCSRPETAEGMCTTEMCDYERTEYPSEFRRMRDPYDLPSNYDYRTEIAPVRKTRKIERHGKLCFSTRPILTCPSHTYATGTKKTEEVEFKCPSKYSSYWGNYDSSSSSSSSSTESGENSKLVTGSQSAETNSDTSSSSAETTRRPSSSHNNKPTGDSSSMSDSESTSSSERFYDSASMSRDVADATGTTTSVTMTVTIPQSCRRL